MELYVETRNASSSNQDMAMQENNPMTESMKNNPFLPPNGCPINDLPNELLSHIFWLGCELNIEEDEDDEEEAYDLDHNFSASDDSEVDSEDDEEEEDHNESSSPYSDTLLPFQTLVSHVCKHWRDVALECPTLWTSISFNDLPPFDKSRTWIERSKGLPLCIDIDCCEGAEPCSHEDMPMEGDKPTTLKPLFSEDDTRMILDIILPHAARWHALTVTVPLYEYMYLVLTRLATCSSAPILEVLLLQHIEHYDEENSFDTFSPAGLNDSFILFHGNAPNLKNVTLWGVHIDWTSHFLSDLKELELAYHTYDVRPSFSEFAHILRSSPNIDTLTLCLSGPSGNPSEDWPAGEIIELPSLSALVLAYHQPEYIGPLLKVVSTPNLANLVLDFDGADCSAFAKQLACPATGSRKSLLAGLEHLKISGLPCDHKTIDVVYAELHNLRSINLNCRYLDGVFFFKLANPIPSPACPTTIPASKRMYCPRLESVVTAGITGKEMTNFVEARSAAGCPVKKVAMSDEDDVEPKHEAWLRRNVEIFEYFEPSDDEDDLSEGDIVEIEEDEDV